MNLYFYVLYARTREASVALILKPLGFRFNIDTFNIEEKLAQTFTNRDDEIRD